MSHTQRLLVIAGVMTAFLVFMLGSNTARRAGGQEVLLDVTGYDPRDPFLGHYSRIRLDIATLDVRELGGLDEVEAEDLVYVALEPDENGVWIASSLHHERPETGPAMLGLVTSVYFRGREDERREVVQIDYGLNRYFADRATALELDSILRDGSRSPRLIVSIPSDGRALIKGIEIDGEPHYERLW